MNRYSHECVNDLAARIRAEPLPRSSQVTLTVEWTHLPSFGDLTLNLLELSPKIPSAARQLRGIDYTRGEQRGQFIETYTKPITPGTHRRRVWSATDLDPLRTQMPNHNCRNVFIQRPLVAAHVSVETGVGHPFSCAMNLHTFTADTAAIDLGALVFTLEGDVVSSGRVAKDRLDCELIVSVDNRFPLPPPNYIAAVDNHSGVTGVQQHSPDRSPAPLLPCSARAVAGSIPLPSNTSQCAAREYFCCCGANRLGLGFDVQAIGGEAERSFCGDPLPRSGTLVIGPFATLRRVFALLTGDTSEDSGNHSASRSGEVECATRDGSYLDSLLVD